MATDRGAAQVELDRTIVRLMKDLLELKRRRNALSHINQLPTEVLSQILYQVLDHTKPQKTSLPNFIPLCHVSSSWRAIVLNTPEFWSTIQLGRALSSSMSIYIWNHSSRHVTTLEYDGACGDGVGADGNVNPCFTYILKQAMPTLRRVSLHGSYHQLKDLIPVLFDHSEALENLKISQETSRQSRNLCARPPVQRFPKLRKLELIGTGFERWNLCHLFPTSLTHLALGNLDYGHEARVFSVLDLLAKTRRLLSLSIVYRKTHTSWGRGPAYSPYGRPVTLSSLISFEIGCEKSTLLDLYLKTLSIPEPSAMSRLKVRYYGTYEPEYIEQLQSSWRDMHAVGDDGISPQEMRIGLDALDVWSETITPPTEAWSKSTASRRAADNQLEPWVSCEGFSPSNLVRIPGHTIHKLWSFDKLLIIDIRLRSIENAQWGLFSTLPQLQVIRLRCAPGLSRKKFPLSRVFLQVLRGELAPDGRIEPAGVFNGQLKRLQENPFPALHAIVYWDSHNLLSHDEYVQELIGSLEVWNANRAIRDGNPEFKLPALELRLFEQHVGTIPTPQNYEENLRKHRPSLLGVAQMVVTA
ncbi:hypothetical protein DFP72DRAFT_895707 [Ephemerocybe angulata]|uniref:F-box domain-containing protein n=1 Tax=Ephemerocybe angulata TaxID=980116 RepID=A0A8H6HZH8_9AGAR|nr:hypothetical protein DFP72DRAFT_895707 [Tulosesus angulatus]